MLKIVETHREPAGGREESWTSTFTCRSRGSVWYTVFRYRHPPCSLSLSSCVSNLPPTHSSSYRSGLYLSPWARSLPATDSKLPQAYNAQIAVPKAIAHSYITLSVPCTPSTHSCWWPLAAGLDHWPPFLIFFPVPTPWTCLCSQPCPTLSVCLHPSPTALNPLMTTQKHFPKACSHCLLGIDSFHPQ